MTSLSPEFVERYQLILEADPKSKVFAPLAEAYRNMGLHKEALQICIQGVQYHPDFSGGRVALARLLIDEGNLKSAIDHLQRAIEISTENVLAQILLAETHIKLKNPKEALKAYKMVLFLNPQHERALKAVKKLESLTADEYDDDVFAMRPLSGETLSEEAPMPLEPMPVSNTMRSLDRFMSLADAYLIRNDFERAEAVLREAHSALGDHPEVLRRLKLLSLRTAEDAPAPSMPEITMAAPLVGVPSLNRQERIRDSKIEMLQQFLERIRERRV